MYGGGLPMPDGLYPHGTRGYIPTGYDLNQVRCEYSTGLKKKALSSQRNFALAKCNCQKESKKWPCFRTHSLTPFNTFYRGWNINPSQLDCLQSAVASLAQPSALGIVRCFTRADDLWSENGDCKHLFSNFAKGNHWPVARVASPWKIDTHNDGMFGQVIPLDQRQVSSTGSG